MTSVTSRRALSECTQRKGTPMPAPMLKVGSITIVPLSDGDLSLKAADIFPAVTAAMWETVSEYLNPDGTMALNLGSFLIHEGDSWTLVDTGYGAGRERAAGACSTSWRRPGSGRMMSRGSSSPTFTVITSAGTPSTAMASRKCSSRTLATSSSGGTGIIGSSRPCFLTARSWNCAPCRWKPLACLTWSTATS